MRLLLTYCDKCDVLMLAPWQRKHLGNEISDEEFLAFSTKVKSTEGMVTAFGWECPTCKRDDLMNYEEYKRELAQKASDKEDKRAIKTAWAVIVFAVIGWALLILFCTGALTTP